MPSPLRKIEWTPLELGGRVGVEPGAGDGAIVVHVEKDTGARVSQQLTELEAKAMLADLYWFIYEYRKRTVRS